MADSVSITIRAKTMEGGWAADPKITLDIFETTPLQRSVVHRVFKNFDTEMVVKLPMPDGFPTWQVNVSFSRFDAVTGFFFQPRGDAQPTFLVKLSRLPTEWTPQFTPLKDLPSPRFDPLRAIVAGSNDVDLKKGKAIGDLSANYDTVDGSPQLLGKCALLNLFAVLCDEIDPIGLRPWFSYVKKIVRLDQERFVAEADPELFENVSKIVANLSGVFGGQGYSTEPALDFLLHYGNVPSRYDVRDTVQQMTTVKKSYRQGDVQLTVMALKVDGAPVHLLDCDMDENSNILLHGFDLKKHTITGGTSPIAMHEYVVETSALAAPDHVATIDLGYVLI